MKILGTASSPYTRKVRIVALEKNLPVEFVVDGPLAPGSAVPGLNPLAKIPVLIRDDGQALVDSPLIAEYLDLAGDGAHLIPLVGPERFAVREWEAIADGALDAAILIRMEMLRPEPQRSAEWIDRQRGKIESVLAELDRRLGAQARCVGPTLTLADIATGCLLAYLQFRFDDGRWHERYANLGRLCAELETRPSFRATPVHA
jgi:glutathione S-transferase